VHELVIVVTDFYLSQEASERELPDGVALPGLQHAARFGKRSRVAGGWRPWLAQWLIADQQSGRGVAAGTGALGAPARGQSALDERALGDPVGASALGQPTPGQSAFDQRALGHRDRELHRAAPATIAAIALARGTTASKPAPPLAMVWMATPVHLVAGLTAVHLDRRSILRLCADDLTALATEFGRVFHDSGFLLEPLDSGDFLLFGPQLPVAQTLEPARAMGSSIADAQPVGAADPALRRLGAELEMWLHEHPINDGRRRRGEAPVTGLWLWGGGPAPQPGDTHQPSDTSPAGAAPSDIAFGRDAYLQGLWASLGKKVFPLPQQLTDVFGYPGVRRTVLVMEIGPMLHSNPMWTFFDAVAQIDRAFIAPAVEALGVAKLERLVILANDHQLTLRARDRFKVWRRTSPGLSGLQ
jgi:hypothetical protein